MLHIFKYLFVFLSFFYFTQSLALESAWSNGIESQVRLLSPLTHNNNQNKMYIGLEYKLEQGWKTYWQSPGEGGFPQEISWDLSENIKDLEILWPLPQYFEILGFTSVGYINEIVFPLKIKIKDINKKTLIILDINYLTCKDICIPGNARLKLTIPPGEGKVTEHYFTIQKGISAVPKPSLEYAGLKSIETKAFEDKDNISIIVSAESKNVIRNPNFFLHSEFGLPVVKPEIQYSPNLKKISAKFDFDKINISKNNFVLNIIFQNNNYFFEHIGNVTIEKFSEISFLNNSIIYILIISLIGGIILNAMPCVLPVLSIKILTVLKQSNDKLLIRRSFIVTSLGIIFSFALLAFVLISLRYFGVNIVWGMQFQQPVFLVIIATILFLFSLNLFGFFEFKTPTFVLNSTMIRNLNKNSYSSDFFNGFFATVLATPCSAPFVGTAITAAFTQSSYTMIGIFIFMGIGMAAPYLLVSIYPGMTKIFPKPGAWTQYIKYFLGILLLGTFIWIVSILMSHYTFFSTNNLKEDSKWIDITTVDLEDLKHNNSIIFVDITADWCATCQFNKINVINSPIIVETFKKNNVIKLRGDWTKSNNNIENFLQQHNRFGIPLNVMYSKSYPEGIVLSELLSKKEIIDTLEMIKVSNE